MAVYLITGASSGIGEQLALQAAECGHKVYGLARSEDKLQSIAKTVGEKFVPLVCDITDEQKVYETCNGLKDIPDVVILNAGTGLFDSKKRFNLDVHKQTFDINYFGAIYFVEALFDKFAERGSGVFVAMASLAAYRGTPASAAYSASKAALSNCFEALRLTYSRQGIDFITVHPGFVDTPMTKVNKDPMPFLYSAEKAAKTILNGVEKGKLNINFPLPMWFAVTLARLIPPCLYKKILALK